MLVSLRNQLQKLCSVKKQVCYYLHLVKKHLINSFDVPLTLINMKPNNWHPFFFLWFPQIKEEKIDQNAAQQTKKGASYDDD